MTEKFKVTGMTCAACSARVEKAVGSLPGVENCTVNLLTGDMSVSGNVTRSAVSDAVKRAGYGVTGEAKTEGNEGNKKESSVLAARLISSLIIVAVLMYIAMGHMAGLPLPGWLDRNPLANALLQMLLASVVMIINKRFFINGVSGLIRRAPNMDTLVSLGSFVSFAYSVYILFVMTADAMAGGENLSHLLHGLYFESAAMILALITLGKMLEERAKGKTTSAIRALIDMTPKTARVLVDGEEREIPVSELKIGDVFAVRPGDSIPIDGEVLFGASSVDESALTGESIPVEKAIGSSVYAGCINKSGFMTCRVTVLPGDTVLSGIIKMVKDATATKAPIAKLADRVSGVFVPLVLAVSAITFAGWMIASGEVGYAVERAISVMVISCPCALGLATPVAIMVGGGVGARRGILYKNATALEECGRIDTVVLDKTGTVTRGEMSVVEVHSFIDEKELLSRALGIERLSEHPIASAGVAYAEEKGVSAAEITDFSNLEGRGVYGKTDGKDLFGVSLGYAKKLTNVDKNIENICENEAKEGRTPILFVRGGECIGILSLQDTLGDGAREGVERLLSLGYRVIMLTGDNEVSARAIAKSVGIGEVIAGVLPEGKESVIRELSQSSRVCMVGDGINDAPALVRANVGIAIGHGTDIAIDSADVVLMTGGVREVSYALGIGRSTLRNIKENLFWAFLYNCIGIPLAAGVFGVSMPPMFGALAMSLSSFCVVTNALRLNLWRPRKIKKIKNSGNVTALQIENNQEMEKTEMTKEYNVKGMMCPHCEARVKSVVEAIPGVTLAVPSHMEKKVTVTFSGEPDDASVVKAITDAGYTVE